MRFGSVPVAEALGAIAAHSVRAGGLTIRKGTVLGRAEIAALLEAGAAEVVAARLEAGDMAENAAAALLADALSGPGVRAERPFTGRANLFAAEAGMFELDTAAVDAFNAVDEAITLATLDHRRPVAAGDMVATVKIIPFGVDRALVDRAAACAAPLSVAPFRRKRVAVVSTLLPGLARKVIAKTLDVTAARLARAGAHIGLDLIVPHEVPALADALARAVAEGAELVAVFGASAIADRRDVIPAALEAAGGRVERLGMPVDPGNLLMLGQLGAVPVLGAPGCARSPKENGFDFVLMRLLAGLDVTARDVARLGVGGLLTEIVTRPQPRAEADGEPRAAAGGRAPVAAVILAAGRGTRMGGGVNKLLAPVGGVAVVRRVAEAALASRARPVIVVTGHEAGAVADALAGLDVRLVHNPDYAAGMATSLKAGIAAVPATSAGALVLLGDMPLVSPALVERVTGAFAPEAGRLVVVPVADGRRGHPVLWSRRFFKDLMALDGDMGARHLIAQHGEAVWDVTVDGAAAFLDVDTPGLLEEARAVAALTP